MLLVAVIALSGSTFAWFANNSTVTAEGLKVQATVEGGIEITHGVATGSSGSYATLANTSLPKAELRPTSTFNTTAWYHASADNATASSARNNTRETLSTVVDSITGVGYVDVNNDNSMGETEPKYYLVDTFNIRSVSDALATGLKVDSVAATGASKNMSNALRVAVVLGDVRGGLNSPIRVGLN